MATAAGALPQLLPLGEVYDGPLHHAVILHARPRGALATGTR
jgi:hypothetical protein